MKSGFGPDLENCVLVMENVLGTKLFLTWVTVNQTKNNSAYNT